MPRLQSARATAADVAEKAALMLADARAPLIVADYTYHGTQLLQRLRERGCGQRARWLNPDELAQAATLSVSCATLAPVAGSLTTSRQTRQAKVTRMQADIHCFLARQKSSLGGLKSASILARTLADMENYLDCDDPFAKINENDSHAAYAAELDFLGLLWQDKASAGQRQRRTQLLEMAERASQPLAYICFQKPPPLFGEFIGKWSQPASLIEIELDETASRLEQLWQQDQSQFGRVRRSLQDTPLAANLSVCAAETLEDASRSAFAQITDWLERGLEKIGIVAYDRALTRRLNAACSAAGICLEDRTGWAADALLVGNCLLAATQQVALGNQTIDNLVQALCIHLHDAGKPWAFPVRNWQRNRSGEFVDLAADLKKWPASARPSDWIEQIVQMAGRPPLESIFANDDTATQLLGYLNQLAVEFEDFTGTLNRAEMLGLLRESIARLHLPAEPANCSLRIIPPNPVVDEPFDALLLLGADATTLPGVPESLAFNETVRQELGLPTRDDVIEDVRRRNAALLAAHANRECLAVSVGSRPSPYLELLVSEKNRRQPTPPPWQHPRLASAISGQRSVTIPASIRPKKISPSGADTLMACPYKFFVEKLLQANEENRFSLFDNARFGQLVHAILKIYHENDGHSDLESLLAQTLADMPLATTERQLMAWRLEPLLEKYRRHFAEHRAGGWQTIVVEEKFARKMDADLDIELAGQLDLLVQDEHGRQAVGDIKTGVITRPEVITGEKPQLLLYAYLAKADPNLSFLRIVRIEAGRARVEDLTMNKAAPELSEMVFARLQEQMQQIFEQGRELRANGAKKTCSNCAAAGMCRQPHWEVGH